MAALWTEVCLATAALSALDDGYEVYMVTDASGGVTAEAHDMAINRKSAFDIDAPVEPRLSGRNGT